MAVSSMYSINRLRFSGLASGLDTESIISDLMKIEQMKVDKLKQEKQLLEWKRDDYREITNLLRGFYDKYFDILYAETNMRSSNTYNTYVAKSSNEEYVTVTANADAIKRDYQITSIQVATAAYVKSSDSVSKGIKSTIEFSEDNNTIDLDGKSIVITLDGVTKMIKFEKNYTKSEFETDFKNDFETLLNEAFGENKINVDVTSDGDGNIILSLVPNSRASTLTMETGEALDILGFEKRESNKINLDNTLLGLKEQFGIELEFVKDDDNNEVIKFNINGVEFTFKSNETLSQVINKINSSNAGVTLYYSSMTDTFRLENKATGAAQGLTFKDESGNFLEVLKLDLQNVETGTDVVVNLKDDKDNEITITRSTNVFTIDGITFNLKKNFNISNTDENNEVIDINITRDVTQAYENIKSFVEDYNELIDKINSELREERFSDYPPLTEDQKKEMTEEEIELWEEKAKSGLLRNDSVLENIVYSMRRALTDQIVYKVVDEAEGESEKLPIGLSSIGITTGLYFERGKLYIDESKLKEALETRPDQVMMLFSKESDIKYSPDLSSEDRDRRYKESGLIHRIYDILQDNIRTIRDESGRKGILLEKAGIVGDTSEFNNVFYDQLKDMEERIDDAIERMYEVEERYWSKFTALETALQQMYSQSAWLSQQFGTGTY